MDDRTKIVPPANSAPMSRPAPGMARQASLRRQFPTVFYLRERARTRIPKLPHLNREVLIQIEEIRSFG